MGLFDLFKKKDKMPKEYTMKFKQEYLDETDNELDLIEKAQNNWIDEANRKGIDKFLSQNPDYVVKQMLAEAIKSCQENTSYAIAKMNNDTDERSAIDAVDLLVMMKVLEVFNDLIDRMTVLNNMVILDEENKLIAGGLIIETIGLFEGLNKASRINKKFVYGWSSYIKQKMTLDSIQYIPERTIQKLGGNYHRIN